MFGFGKRKDVFDVLFGAGAPAAREEFSADHASDSPAAGVPRYAVEALAAYRSAWDDGEKFPGGFGPTLLLATDYWTLRARSAQLFETNIYGRGVMRRLITNEINTGLHLECTPEESILGKEEDALVDWSEDVESRFLIWAKDPYLCDFYERSTFGALQQQVRMESLIDGDCLVVMRQDQRTKLPRIQLIRGSSVESPMTDVPQKGNKICHGVEVDPSGKHVAFWVRQEDGTIKRLPAWGEKSGRRIAWLVYGTEKRLDEVRGKPLLSLVLQSLREIDRYRDSTQRKAAALSMIAAFIEKTEDVKGSRAFTAGAVRKDVELAIDGTSDEPRTYKTQQMMPGVFIDELRHGEKPQAFQVNGTTENFGDFEEAIICAVAWTLEIPPEILRLAFSSNYSASQAAVNEFKQYLNKMRMGFAEAFCEPIYQEWMISEVLNQRVDAPGLYEAWQDFWNKFEIVGAWLASDWTGNIKPSVDPLKTAEGYEKLIEMGLCTRDRAARETTGTKFSKNARKIKRENVQMAEANKPMAELKAAEKPKPPPPPAGFGGPPDDKSPAKPAKPPQKATHEALVD
jgi:lambda family phage portal protein